MKAEMKTGRGRRQFVDKIIVSAVDEHSSARTAIEFFGECGMVIVGGGADMKSVKDFYNKTANEWAEKWYPDETMLPLLKKFIGLFDGKKPRILDAGCGAGYESMRLAKLGADVVGIDISEESIKIAKMKNPDCRFEVTDCKCLGEQLGIFDGIAAICMIVHIEDSDIKTVFDNFRKVIKPEGFMFVTFVEGDGFNEKRSFLEVAGEKYNRAFYLHMPDRITEVAENSGFKYFDEWFLDEPIGNWKHYVFQAFML